MGILNKLFRKSKNEIKPQVPEQAVIVRFLYGIEGLEPLHRLEKELERSIEQAGVGDYDGHEIATDYNDGFLYLYGPSADALFKTIQPILEQADFMKGAIVKLRFGPPEEGVKETKVKIRE